MEVYLFKDIMASGGQNRLTREKVIEQFIEVHGDDFDYSKVVYVNTHTPIEVRCKKHDFIFFPTPKNHKSGAKCTMCGREAQTEKSIYHTGGNHPAGGNLVFYHVQRF